MNKSTRYSPEVRERAVRMVLEHQAGYGSQWAAIVSMAGKIGCTAETLRKWVRGPERDAGVRPGQKSEEDERLKALERENRELRRANEILRKAAAFSPRRSSTAAGRKGVVHRRAPGDVWGRADLQGVTDRPFHLLRVQGARGRSCSCAGAGLAWVWWTPDKRR